MSEPFYPAIPMSLKLNPSIPVSLSTDLCLSEPLHPSQPKMGYKQDRVLWSWVEALGSAELMPIRLATTQLFLVLHCVISGLYYNPRASLNPTLNPKP